MTGLAWPDPSSRWALAIAAATWMGVVGGVAQHPGDTFVSGAGVAALALCGCLVAGAWWRRLPLLAVVGLLATLGVVSGALLADRVASSAEHLPAGPSRVWVDVVASGTEGPWSGQALVRPYALVVAGEARLWQGPVGMLSGEGLAVWEEGQRWMVTTVFRSLSPDVGSRARWRGVARDPEILPGEPAALRRLAGAARRRILEVIGPARSEARALLAGFLIGDTSHLGGLAEEDMRRAGLSHFVAVSGSNVALFLGALFVAAGPLGWSTRRRALLGVAGLAFFVLLVGPDPSVIRAATMAVLVLAARAIGLRPPVWMVIGAGVTIVLLVSPELAFSLGFQLSVAATGGVVLGAGLFPSVRPGWVASTLGASIGAQVAVAPVLLLTIGSVPMWSPVANVAAGGFVAAATALGGLGAVTGWQLLVAVAEAAAKVVLVVAGLVAPLPQVSARGAGLLVLLAGLARWRVIRPAIALVAALIVLVGVGPVRVSTAGPSFVALDVGQGDALLLLGARGETVLVDAGPSGVEVLDALARHGVESIDLLVITHGHLDHYGGAGAVVERIPIGRLWHPPFRAGDGAYARWVEEVSERTVATSPTLGRHRIGTMVLDVLGPVRRYASTNDASLVILATVGPSSVLLTGDVEEIAQDDLSPPPADILKVPHHGAATSDESWLVATGADIAVVSVGANDFGHPSPGLMESLHSAGMEVLRTDRHGDVVVDLDRLVGG